MQRQTKVSVGSTLPLPPTKGTSWQFVQADARWTRSVSTSTTELRRIRTQFVSCSTVHQKTPPSSRSAFCLRWEYTFIMCIILSLLSYANASEHLRVVKHVSYIIDLVNGCIVLYRIRRCCWNFITNKSKRITKFFWSFIIPQYRHLQGGPKKVNPKCSTHNFVKCWPILKILSLL